MKFSLNHAVNLHNSSIYLVATDSLLKSSAKLTLQVLETIRPEAVIIQMCEERRHLVEITADRLNRYEKLREEYSAVKHILYRMKKR